MFHWSRLERAVPCVDQDRSHMCVQRGKKTNWHPMVKQICLLALHRVQLWWIMTGKVADPTNSRDICGLHPRWTPNQQTEFHVHHTLRCPHLAPAGDFHLSVFSDVWQRPNTFGGSAYICVWTLLMVGVPGLPCPLSLEVLKMCTESIGAMQAFVFSLSE